MTRMIIAATMAGAMLAQAVLPASATVADFKSYAKAAGEIGVARSSCNFDMNVKTLLEVGRKFAVNPADTALQDKLADEIAAGLAAAQKRYQAEGEQAFCRNMLSAYGPSGNVVAGVLKAR